MKLRPITIKEANLIVAQCHRHNKPTQGGRFALAAEHEGVIVGVAIVGRTIARLLHDDLTAEVTRLCSVPNAPKNTCSFLYGACRRVWQTMGGTRLVTYTLKSEGGSSLTAAGWAKTAEVAGGQWSVPSRQREFQLVCDEPKLRWEAPITLGNDRLLRAGIENLTES